MGKISKIGFLLDNILSHLISLERGRSSDREKLASCLLKALPTFCQKNGADLNLSQLRKAAMFSRAYLEVLADHLPQLDKFREEELISVLQVSYNWTDFEKTSKWVLAAPMAKHLRQEKLADGLPPKPPGEIHLFPFTPPVKRYLDKVVRSRKDKKVLHLFSSLLLGVKRACAEPSPEMVKDSLKKHSQVLGRTPPDIESDLRRLRPYFSRALQGIERFKPGPLRDTGGASFKTTRSLGGKFEEVIRRYHGVSFSEPLVASDLLYMDEKRSVYGRLVPTYPEIRALVAEVDSVKAIGLLEALKVRTITTGDAATSVYLEQYRKQIHDFLRKKSCLSALGAPKIQESDLRSLHERETGLGLRFPWWVSGDYTAATDNLNMSVTRAAITSICQKLGCEVDRGIIENSLCRTHLKYPSPELDTVQKNGQLMGNPLSFPILCLANLAGYWSALEKYLGRPVELENLPVLINGDDILFRADKEFLELWRDQIKTLGFTLSIGKYYVHPRVCTLNSQFFVDYKEVGYYNPGLIFKGFAGNKKKVQFLPVEAIASELLKGSWNKSRAFVRFKHYWGATLAQATSQGRQNLFLPRSAGGLGADPEGLILGQDFYISEENKRLSWSLHQLQNWHPILALDWTNCPLRENLNQNLICDQRWSKGAVWLEPGEPDYQILEAKGLKIIPHKKVIEINSKALLRPQGSVDQIFPTFVMGQPIRAGDPIFLPKVRTGSSPEPHSFLPSPDRQDFEDLEKKIKNFPPGSFRLERSFDPKVEAQWWRRISKRDFRRLYSWFPPPPIPLPDPVERKLQRYSGRILS